MNNDFKLNEIRKNCVEENNTIKTEYMLNFKSDEDLKTIILKGTGKIKETITI